jgi:ABC-2 type transport system permease protein
MKFNYYAFRAMYLHEMDRFKRTLMQSLFSPVLSTSLYFIVFGSVIGGYVENIDGISYGSFIVPGLLMLTLLTQSISNTSFGIFFPKFNGTMYEILAAPISTFEIVLAFVGAGATKTLLVGVVIFITATFFCRSSGDVSIVNDFSISSCGFYLCFIWVFNWLDEF